MKKRVMLLALGAVCILMAAMPVLADEARLMRNADVHGDRIVFTYEDDLWLVSVAGGPAWRITRHPGVERYAKFSPDGQWIAFTGSYDGGRDVYLMAAGGGEPSRLTFHPSRDRVLGWMPDGTSVYFRSNRERPQRGERVYTVAVEQGGMPRALPIDRAGLSAVSPDGQSIAYNRISREDRTWKRYRGGMAQNLWVGRMDQQAYKPVTDWTGTDNYPMWQGDSIYFTSDREQGTLNLYRCDPEGGGVTRLTSYDDYDVKYPSMGPGAIVYQYGEALHLFDLAAGSATKVPVEIPSDRVPLRPEYLSLDDNFGSFGLSPSGARLLLEARGELVNLSTEDKGMPVNLTGTSASREKNGAWSPDGKWIAFVSDRSGEEEIYLVEQGGGEWRQVSSGGIGFRMQPVWSPDSRHLVFSDKFMRLNLLDVESGGIQVIDQGLFDDAWERWGIQDYSWSPDSRWIAYTRMGGNLNENIWLYDLESAEKHQVSGPMTTDWSPSFDPGGEYLYFLSNRTFAPMMGLVDQNHIFIDMARPYMVLLRDDLRSPFAPEAFLEKGSGDEEEESAEGDDETIATVIHTTDLHKRIIAVEGVEAGNYFRLEALDDGFLFLAKTEKEFLKYQNVNDLTGGALELRHYVTEDREAKTLLSGIRNYHLSADREKMVYRYGNRFGVADTGKEAKADDGKVDLSAIRLRVDRKEEFLQIFNEAWRIQRDWFYDPGMHGVDWAATGEKYRVLVPWCGNRGDLNYLIGEMIGELSIGHTYIFGGDFGQRPPTVAVGLLGVDFAEPSGKGFHRIGHIIPGTSWNPAERSPLDEPGCPISEGDYIIAVNGRPVTDGENIYGAFEDTAGKPVRLTWNRTPATEGAEEWLVTPLRSERGIRYRQWVESRRRQVDEASGGTIGYLHIPDMGQRGLIEFARAFYPQVDKQALIIDERYNGGGFVGDMIIDRLERQLWSYTVPREGGPGRNPERVGSDKLAVLINEDTGSNGEFFAEALKQKELATIIGMRTWGGTVGIEPHQGFVDGGGTTPPQFGLLGTDRTWLVEGHGVEPDMEVQNMPGDVIQGKDAQLEAAVNLLLERIGGDPSALPDIPAYPVKKKVTE